MKNDREFLDGIYQKAEILEREKLQEDSKKKSPYKKYIPYSSVAAMFILLPILLLSKEALSPGNELPGQEPMMIRMDEPGSIFIEADYLLIGQVEYIEKKSNEGTMEIEISLEEILKGQIQEEKIIVEAPSNMKDEFKEGDRSLFLLYKEDNIYKLLGEREGQFKEENSHMFIDRFGDKYRLEEIKNIIKGED